MTTIIALFIATSAATVSQPMISSRYIDYFPSTILGKEVSESISTSGHAKEFSIDFSGKSSNVIFGVSVVLEDFTITHRDAGASDVRMNSFGFMTDLRYRFSTSPIQPYLALQIGVNTLDVTTLSDGAETALTDAGVLIVPSGGFMFNIKNLVLIDLNIRSHRSMGGEIHLSDEVTTVGFNGIGVGVGAGLLL